MTTELYVIPPTYRAIAVAVGLAVRPGYQVDAVRRWVDQLLHQYLAPLPETVLGLTARIAISAGAWAALGTWLMRPVLLDALRVARPMLPPRRRWGATSGP